MKCKKAIALIISMILVVAFCIPAYADLATSSNAVLGLTPPEYLLSAVADDADSGIAPASSLSSFTNTVTKVSGVSINYWATNDSGQVYKWYTNKSVSLVNGRIKLQPFSLDDYPALDGWWISAVQLRIASPALPPSGAYYIQFDFASDFSIDYRTQPDIYGIRYLNNSTESTAFHYPNSYQVSSGDVYATYYYNVSGDVVQFDLNPVHGSLRNFGGSYAIRFAPTSESVEDGPRAPSSIDIENSISDSTSQIADSVGSMSSDLSDAAESLTYISNSQNLIIQGIDNIILHISDQLYAFWDQLYNLIHVPTLAKMNEILNAIQNVDINITGDLTAAINEMSDAITDKLGSVTNQQITNDNQNTGEIVNGYDNSSMESDADRLQSTIDQYDAVEDQLFNDAKENIEDFEFNSSLEELTAPLSDISYFLSAIYTGFGVVNTAVTFSLMLSVALIMIGWYRFKGGG